MKKTLILMAFFIGACGAPVSALTTEYRTPQPTETASIVPTATIEYQATAHAAETQAYIAQSTADAANRIMVQATNDQQQREHEAAQQNAQGTQQAESNAMVKLGWTATAALTAIPATQTQQVIANTQIPAQQTLMAGVLTATYQAPTQMVANANAEAQANFAPVYAGVQVFAIFSIAVFLLFAAYMMRWYWMRQDAREQAASPMGVAERDGFKPIAKIQPQPEPEPQIIQPEPEMMITVKQNLGDGNMRMDKYIVPCTKDMLLQFAENVLTKGWSLAINQWESAETLFTRGTFSQLRSWLQSNRFAISAGGGTLALTDSGRAFLDAFLQKAQLPTEYQFGEMAVTQ